MQDARSLRFVLLLFSIAVALPSAVAQVVIATVPVGFHPLGVAVNSVTNKIYVTNYCNDPSCSIGATVTVIDGDTRSTTSVNVGTGPYAVVANPLTNKVYVVNRYSNNVTVIDGTSNSTTIVGVGRSPVAAAVNSLTNKIYVANGMDNTVTVIDGATLATSTVAVGFNPFAVGINSVTNKIYVVNESDNTVTEIDGVTNSTSTITVGYTPNALDINSLTNKIYVANVCGNDFGCQTATVTVIDGVTHFTDTVLVDPTPSSLAVDTLTNRIYVPSVSDDTVIVIAGQTLSTTTVSVATQPYGLAIDAATNKIYLIGSGSSNLMMIDGSNNSTTSIQVGNHPDALAVNPVTNRIYVANHDDNTVSVVAGANSTTLQFVPITPCRLVDTRPGSGGSGPIPGGTSESFNLPQAAQQSMGCPMLDLSTAAAYSLNLTVVPPGPLGYVTIWPTGEDQPVASTLNSVDGRVKANAAIVPAGYQGAVSIFASNTTNVVLDIDGYFTTPTVQTLQFYTLPPCRVADTRDNSYPPELGPPSLTGGMARDFPVLLSNCFANIPNTAQAYSFNFTVVPPGPLGYLTMWPAGQSQPVVSTLNDVTGTVVANAAIVPAGQGGEGDIMALASNDTDLVIDVNGYFAPAGQNGLSLYSVAPCRVLDTRQVGNGQPFVGELMPPVDVVNSVCGPSILAQAYVFNATVVPSGPLGYLTLWPDGGMQPGVSTLNAIDGAVTSNMAIVPTMNGSIDAFASNLTQLILDISAYFAP